MDQAIIIMGILDFIAAAEEMRRKRKRIGRIKKAALAARTAFQCMAEREGFEPSVEYDPHTRLAGEHHRPARSSLLYFAQHLMSELAEEVGFEPTVLSYNGFQDRRLQPLGHSS